LFPASCTHCCRKKQFTSLAQQALVALANASKGGLDHSAIVTFIERMAGLEVKKPLAGKLTEACQQAMNGPCPLSRSHIQVLFGVGDALRVVVVLGFHLRVRA
jgi:hypothetical protein